jgi:hypothetical protein
MTKQYDTEEQIEAFNAYVKRNPAGRQVHHTGTLGYEEDEWHAFQEGWNAALAQPAQEPDELTIAYMSGLYDGKKKRPWVGLTDEEHCDIWYKESLDWMEYGKAIEAKLKEKNT